MDWLNQASQAISILFLECHDLSRMQFLQLVKYTNTILTYLVSIFNSSCKNPRENDKDLL